MAARGEPPLLVELAGIGQVSFRNDAQHTAAIADDGTIEQLAIQTQWHAHDPNRRERFALLEQARERGFTRIQQSILVKEIFVGIRGQAEFRKQSDGRIGLRGAPGELQSSLKVEGGISHTERRDAYRSANEAV